MGILAVSSFSIIYTENIIKGYSLGKLLFGRDNILPVEHTVYWSLIFQRNKAQINKYNIRKNSKILYHKYKVVDKVIINNNAAFQNETTYKGTFGITKSYNNSKVKLQYVVETIRYNICRINLYTSDTNFDGIIVEK